VPVAGATQRCGGHSEPAKARRAESAAATRHAEPARAPSP
jgi:hypothetical protein